MTAIPTFGEILKSGEARLREADIAEARHEARLMLLHAAGIQYAALVSGEHDAVPAHVIETYEGMIRDRIARRPVQHILGAVGFYGLELLCDARALIPRPDSETIVVEALNLLPEGEEVFVADLGTGSGCLLAAILANRPFAAGVGVEADAAAASLVRENLQRLGLHTRATVFEGSWADWEDWARADVIVSNPPYIASAVIPGLMPEVRDHDPHAALDGGADGLDAYREIIGLAAKRMKPGAWLIFEIGYDQREAVLALFDDAGFVEPGASQDLGANDRAVWARWPIL